MRESVLLNWVVRYQPVVAFLERLPASSAVLEVGSGAVGLGCLYGDSFVGCDVEFGGPPRPRLQPVIASALQLPFADRAFPAVVCLDVLEHVPPSQREALLGELVRVARQTVILAFPRGDGARRADASLARCYHVLRRTQPDWLPEHLTWPLPSRREVEMLLDSSSLSYTQQDNTLWPWHLLVMFMDSTPLGPWLARLAKGHGRLLRWLSYWADRGHLPGWPVAPYRSIYWIDKRGTA